MECFAKTFQDWRTVKQATVLASDLVLDSLEKAASTVTVAGSEIADDCAGSWLILDCRPYLIQQIKPNRGSTALSLLCPLDAFSRKVLFREQPEAQTIGGFILDTLRTNWVACPDPIFAMPYLMVSNSDTTAFVLPELDDAGLFSLPDYCRMVRRTYGICTDFFLAAGTLVCQIGVPPAAIRQVSFDDGRSQLKSADFAAAGTAKITTLQEGTVIDWYLTESGEISREIPERRAPGNWITISVASNADAAQKVAETFAKNKSGMKVEFFSELDLDVMNRCVFMINGHRLTTYISSKRRRSSDLRTLYTAGELATTATEKMKGALK